MTEQTIGHLITVPEVETVIRLDLADREDVQACKNLLSSFVVTDEIEKALRHFLRRVSEKQGAAAFLRGNYGSGKSHFLSILALLLETTELWDYFRHNLLKDYQSLANEKILVVKIALHHFSSGESLESILLGETEKAINRRRAEPVLLRRGAVLLEHFNRYVLPQHPEFLRQINKSRSDWEALCRTKPQYTIQLAYSFITTNQIPLKPVFDRREALESLIQMLKQDDYSAVFFAIDELSEFLKAKTSPAAFTEDLRFLQFLGEETGSETGLPIYLIAALQENIEKTGYIEKDLVSRIKDRFPVRFNLSAHHVNQLIARRLIHKNDGAVPEIKTIYRNFVRMFPQVQTEEKIFIDIYPVHPDTVQLLEGLTPIFSQHRGVVDFIYHQLQGDPNRNWPGMLDLPASRLMTPDMIFDHFQDRLHEIPELAPYVDVVFQTLQQEIGSLFESEEDRSIALRTVKILILIELNMIEKHATIERLAQMINQPVSDIDQSLNYSYLEQVILEKLIREGSFVIKKQLDSGQTVYSISLEMTVHQMVRNRVRDFYNQAVEIEREIPGLFFHLHHAQIPFLALAKSRRKNYQFDWQNTRREGWVIFKAHGELEPGEVEELNRDLQNSERDFVLFILGQHKNTWPNPPSLTPGMFKSALPPTLLIWMARPFQVQETEFLRQFRAYDQLMQELRSGSSPQEKQMRQIVEDWLEEHQTEFAGIIEDAYFNGRLADAEGWREFQFSSFYPDFKSILKQIFSPILQDVFPRHSEIMPGDRIPPFAADKLFLHLIRPGIVSREEARAQNIESLIESYLFPLKLVKKEADRYSLNLSESENELLKNLLEDCSGESPESLYNLYWRWRKSEWGITRESFQFLIASLLAAGRLTAFQSGNPVPFNNLTQLNDGSIDAVGEGKLIPEVVQQALQSFLKLPQFQQLSPHFSVSVQEQFWRTLRDFRTTVHRVLQRWQVLEQRYQTYPAFEAIITEEKRDYSLLEEFCTQIRISYPARNGLEKLVEELGTAGVQQIPDLYLSLLNQSDFIENHFVELNQIYVYLENPRLIRSTSALGNDLIKEAEEIKYDLTQNRQSPETGIDQLTQKFYKFRNDYITAYTEQHKSYYAAPVFNLANKLEGEAIVQVLKRFHRVETVVCSPDWILLQERLAKLPRQCRRFADKQLISTPVCECGFLPGLSEPEAPLQELKEMATAGVLSGLNQIQTDFRWILEDYAQRLKEIGKDELAEALNNLLSFPKEKVEKRSGQLLALLSNDLLAEINSAIQGKALIVKRSLKSLQQRLTGKQYQLRQIRKIIEEWLTGDETIPEDTFIQIQNEQEFPNFDTGNYQIYQPMVREDGDRFFQASYLLGWALIHENEFWLDWVKNKFRYQQIDAGVILQTTLEKVNSGDADQIAAYFTRSGMEEQLLRLVSPEKLPLSDIMRFLIKEILWEALSIQVGRQLLSKTALTEPLPQTLMNFRKELTGNCRYGQWPHLQFIDNLLTLLETITEGEHAGNLLAFYLERGWQIPLLLTSTAQANRTLHFIPVDRYKSLQKRVEQVLPKLTFRQNKFAKKGLPLPCWPMQNCPQSVYKELEKEHSLPVVLIIDGMRWDVWQALHPVFQDWLRPRTLNTEAAVEAASPTTTEQNRKQLVEFLLNLTGAPEWRLETVAEKPAVAGKISQQIKDNSSLLILNTTVLDTLLHEREEPLNALIEVLQTRLTALIKPILDEIPPEKPVILTSDHGFVEHESGFTHGGDSFFEKIVPFSIWKTI